MIYQETFITLLVLLLDLAKLSFGAHQNFFNFTPNTSVAYHRFALSYVVKMF